MISVDEVFSEREDFMWKMFGISLRMKTNILTPNALYLIL